MYIGLPIWYNTVVKDYRGERQQDLLELMKLNNFNLAEISIDYPWPYRDVEPLYKFIEVLMDYGFKMGLHAPWRDLQLASPYRELAKASLRVLIDSIKPVLQYPVEYVVVHVTTAQKLGLQGVDEDAVDTAIDVLDELSLFLEDYGATLAIENLPNNLASNPEKLLEIARATGVDLTLDIGHLYIAYVKQYSRHYSDFYEFLKDFLSMAGSDVKVSIVHYHDALVRGEHYVDHLIPGRGDIDYKRVLKLLRGHDIRYFIIESFKDHEGKQIKIEQVIQNVREFMIWLRVHLT